MAKICSELEAGGTSYGPEITPDTVQKASFHGGRFQAA